MGRPVLVEANLARQLQHAGYQRRAGLGQRHASSLGTLGIELEQAFILIIRMSGFGLDCGFSGACCLFMPRLAVMVMPLFFAMLMPVLFFMGMTLVCSAVTMAFGACSRWLRTVDNRCSSSRTERQNDGDGNRRAAGLGRCGIHDTCLFLLKTGYIAQLAGDVGSRLMGCHQLLQI
ncbi:hypothetical protein SDC9_140647 [bioreactor metagenome]|uniref:Uncharacterized protein n=1 Tax=bioreactor metagenome TaxID=1076179 RepID=A0A645DW39_9ZZZZ